MLGFFHLQKKSKDPRPFTLAFWTETLHVFLLQASQDFTHRAKPAMQKPSLNPGCLQALQRFLQTIPVLEGALRCKICIVGSPTEKWVLKNLSAYVGNYLKQFGARGMAQQIKVLLLSLKARVQSLELHHERKELTPTSFSLTSKGGAGTSDSPPYPHTNKCLKKLI